MACAQDFGLAHKGKGKGKGKLHPRTGHEGPEVAVEV
jgi:hypothetical protein